MLIEHLIDVGADQVGDLGLGDLDTFYKAASVKFEHDADFQARARARVVLLQSHDPETVRLWQMLVAQSSRHWNDLYLKLGVLLTDDDLAGEHRYEELMPEIVDRLEAAGLLQESDGAQVVFPPGFTNRDGDPLPLIVRSRVGAFTYATSDLACVVDRVERVGAETLLYVVGAEQAQHLAMIFAVSRMAGWLEPPAEAVHVSFGLVLGSDRKRLRSRSGEPVRFVDVVDEAIERGMAAVVEKNPSCPRRSRQRSGTPSASARSSTPICRPIGCATTSSTGTACCRSTATRRRTCSTPMLASARSSAEQASIGRLSAASRRCPRASGAGARHAGARLPAAVAETVDRSSPHRLCTYLYDLASDFTAFYEHCPVLKAADGGTRVSRLALSDVTARVLAQGLGLLGIDAPDQL